MSDIFDFGFTAVTEDELEVAKAKAEVETAATGTQDKLDKLYNAVEDSPRFLTVNAA